MSCGFTGLHRVSRAGVSHTLPLPPARSTISPEFKRGLLKFQLFKLLLLLLLQWSARFAFVSGDFLQT